MQKNQLLNVKNIFLMFLMGFEAVLLTITYFHQTENLFVYSILGAWIIGMLYCIYDIYDRVFFFMYLLAFFNFLMGRSLLIALGIFREPYRFTIAENIAGQKLVLISILVLVGSFILFDKWIKTKPQENKLDPNNLEIRKIRLVSKYLYLATYLFLIVSVFATVLYVRRHGYASIYVDTGAKVPGIIKKIGDIAPFAFFVYLGTLPTKRDSFLSVALYGFYLVLSLGTGARFEFVIGALTLFAYFILRNKLTPEEPWLPRRSIKYYVAVGLATIALLSAYNSIRFQQSVQTKDPVQLVTQFSFDQGISVNIPKRIFKYNAKIPKDRYYSLDSIISFYQRNIGHPLFGTTYYSGASVDRALNGNSLADVLSYIMYRNKYLEGIGGGSSYIAEVYLDFGMLGLILINLLYARVFVALRKYHASSPYWFMIVMMIFMSFLRTPRARTDGIFLKMLDPMLWISMALIFILVRTVVKVRTNQQLQTKVVEHG